MKCFECGETLSPSGRCANMECPEFVPLEDEYNSVQELDFEKDTSDPWGTDNLEDGSMDDYIDFTFEELDDGDD